MTKRIQAKHKIERRYGVCLWGQESSPVHARPRPAGQHGPKGPRRLTDYGKQLAAKQKLKGYYGNIVERQFRRIYAEAVRRRGDTGANFLALLESRLDAAVYRLKFAPTVFSARQLVNHKHVLVNGKCVNIASYTLKNGDVVSLKPSMWQNTVVLMAKENKSMEIPTYWEYDVTHHTGKLVHTPTPDKIPYPIQMNVSSVIELYAR